MKHTPGPWIVRHMENAVRKWPVIINEARTIQIAEMINAEYAEANARLIAAAPKLLEALKALCERGRDLGDSYYNKDDQSGMKGNDTLFAEAEDAIAKATGKL